ncbi:RNA polymerase II elongation factor [Actinomortierella ambigua]|uniref:Transcription elongation factor n=1 Tax=Actinomortierella ambigua TaxID=1343610 RepID=A0A9P6UAK7_9FUNG|nr:RNA polymerase II elongation factor [Actinomortierella ambigua]KAG0266381.1 RNA polymerase II elongation factor [Actinomortierella ambigua]
MGSKEEADLMDLKKALQDEISKGSVSNMISLLKRLSKFKVNAALLRKTEMGVFVNKLRTHKDDEVSRLSKEVVKSWKNQVQSAAATSTSTPSTSTSSPSSTTSSSSNTSNRPAALDTTKREQLQNVGGDSNSSSPKTPTTPSSSSSSTNAVAKDRTIRTDDMRIKSTGDLTRDKCIEMLYSGLGTQSFADSERLMEKSVRIESVIFKDLSKGGTPSAEYKAKIRSLFLNLRDKNNPNLREAIVSGELTVEKFCKLSTKEMASEDAKARDRAIHEANIFKAKGAGETEAETDMFRCGKCKSRKCTYFQMQTRSADEPMTTFVTCRNCGNRWKFC